MDIYRRKVVRDGCSFAGLALLSGCGGGQSHVEENSPPSGATDERVDADKPAVVTEETSLSVPFSTGGTPATVIEPDGRQIRCLSVQLTEPQQIKFLDYWPFHVNSDSAAYGTRHVMTVGEWVSFDDGFLHLIKVDRPAAGDTGRAHFGRRIKVSRTESGTALMMANSVLEGLALNELVFSNSITADGIYLFISGNSRPAQLYEVGARLPVPAKVGNMVCRVVAVHVAKGELPAYAELKLEVA